MFRLCLTLSIIAFSTSLSLAQSPPLKGGAVAKPGAVLKSGAALLPSQGFQSSPLLYAQRIKRVPELAVTSLVNGVVGPTHDPRGAYVVGRVKNIGNGSYPAGCVYELRLGGVLLKKGVLPAVAPGQEVSVRYDWPGLKPKDALSLHIFPRDANRKNDSMTIVPK